MSEKRDFKNIEVVDVENLPHIKRILDVIRGMGYIITNVSVVENEGVTWEGHHKDDPDNKTRGFVEFIKN